MKDKELEYIEDLDQSLLNPEYMYRQNNRNKMDKLFIERKAILTLDNGAKIEAVVTMPFT